MDFFQNKEYRAYYLKNTLDTLVSMENQNLPQDTSRLPQARLKSGSKRQTSPVQHADPISGYHLSPLSDNASLQDRCLMAQNALFFGGSFSLKDGDEENRMVHSLVTKRPLPFKQNFTLLWTMNSALLLGHRTI
ncbi:hypothetical protein Bca52824_049107 [Brassica carinata]|uniref:Uncharacterized protein n=1 Tax=Brassica carinata TaxID=52824 RepID=A0A8X7RM27_BRACI|nr:hypothetical protein Bca52824_049107 [Brassica carinata]